MIGSRNLQQLHRSAKPCSFQLYFCLVELLGDTLRERTSSNGSLASTKAKVTLTGCDSLKNATRIKKMDHRLIISDLKWLTHVHSVDYELAMSQIKRENES
eukprot:scpid36187/ scgid29932/ 